MRRLYEPLPAVLAEPYAAGGERRIRRVKYPDPWLVRMPRVDAVRDTGIRV